MLIGNRTGRRGQSAGTGSEPGGAGRRGQADGTGAGMGEHCVCATCGYRVAHQLGVPCIDMNCPNCGRVMNCEQMFV